MGTGRADDPASQAWRPPARGECPRGSERRLLRAFDRLPVAGAAEGPAAQEHGALLLHAVGLGWPAGAPPTLYVSTREQEGREASPTAAIIDSQSAKAAQKGAPRSTRKALMRARKSRPASGISSSTRSAFS